jgi:hypothetical protein
MLWTIGDLSKRVTPYELATLASRIWGERIVEDPATALKDALEILCHAIAEIRRTARDEREVAQESEEDERIGNTKSVSWAKGAKEITREQRRDRAMHKFAELMKHESPGSLAGYRRDGFTPNEIYKLQRKFAGWRKQPKGKQGRRLSEQDGRLRTELSGLVPRKPKKQA